MKRWDRSTSSYRWYSIHLEPCSICLRRSVKPHYIPAPLKSSHPALPPVPPDISPYFVSVPPQNKSSIGALFSSIYSRVAWLIPVRGLPPWEGASRASIALSHVPGSLKGDRHLSAGSNSVIIWTYSSFRHFWTFLRSCLETPGSVTGPLSLSFCTASPRSDPTGSQRASESSTTSVYLPRQQRDRNNPVRLLVAHTDRQCFKESARRYRLCEGIL